MSEDVKAKMIFYCPSLCHITICEAININDVATNAAKIAGSYKGPGQ